MFLTLCCLSLPGPCCNEECKAADETTICKDGNDCFELARCPSAQERRNKAITNYTCPNPKMRPDGTECEGGALLCHNGLCTKSICTKYALKPCECKDMKEECHACCIDDGVCRSAYKIDEVHICIGPGGILCPSLFIWVVDLYVTAAPP